MTWRRSDLLDMYDKVSPPQKTKVGRLDGYLITMIDKDVEEGAAPRHITKVFVKIMRQTWIWTYESAGSSKANESELQTLLKSIKQWFVPPA